MNKITSSPKKILIIGPSWVGDMVMAQSLFISLKQQHPDAILDVMAPEWSKAITERMPEINKTLDMPIGHGNFNFFQRRNLGKTLRKEGYHQAIVLPNSWKSALIPWFANIPIRTGWKGEARYGLLNDLRHLNKLNMPLMVQRFVALGYEHHSPVSAEQCPPPQLHAKDHLQNQLMIKHQLNTHKPIAVFCPGAEFGPAKQWPAKHYKQLAESMLAKNWQIWIMGSPGDNPIAEEISSGIQAKDIINLCGKTQLEEAIDLMDLADHVISNDSGLMHIAAGLNKPLTALYGATSPDFTPPLSHEATIIATDVDCGPCFQRKCPEGHHKCMQDLLPEQVVATISE